MKLKARWAARRSLGQYPAKYCPVPPVPTPLVQQVIHPRKAQTSYKKSGSDDFSFYFILSIKVDLFIELNRCLEIQNILLSRLVHKRFLFFFLFRCLSAGMQFGISKHYCETSLLERLHAYKH